MTARHKPPRHAIERVEVPPAIDALARRRTEFLLRRISCFDMPLRSALASAWLQGLGDGVSALDHGGRLVEASDAPPRPQEPPQRRRFVSNPDATSPHVMRLFGVEAWDDPQV